jgi:signal transduction histidine kinase
LQAAAVPLPPDPPRSTALAEPPVPTTLFDAGHLWHHGAQVALANVVIAALIATLHGGAFGRTLVYAQCIGLSIWLIIEFGRRLVATGSNGWPAGWRGIALVAVGCLLGYVAGTTVSDAIFGYSSWGDYLHQPRLLVRDLGPTVTFCTIVAGWFYVRGQARAHRALAAAAAHDATLARLNLLQSQLEPHMLFNTLANLRALIGADPPHAQEMLDRLIGFLRATLAASRLAEHSLADEFARIDDYLSLMQVRMGDRLRASTTLPPELAAIAVPPLLLQPLVENAIKHGLEPQRGAGELRVVAALEGATLVLGVSDSGRGLEAAAAARAREPAEPGSGFGLAQVRERLRTLHGDAARFTLATRADGGTLAEIRLPITPRRAS